MSRGNAGIWLRKISGAIAMDRRRRSKLLLLMQVGLNVAGFALLFLIIWFIFYRYNLQTAFLYKKGTAILIFIYSALYFILCQIYGGHNVGHLRLSEIIYSQFISMLFVNVITWLQICLIDRAVVAASPMVILSVADTAFIFIWSFLCNRSFQKYNSAKKMVVVYGGNEPSALISKMKCYEYKFKIVSMVKVESSFKELLPKLSRRYGLVLSGVEPSIAKEITRYCFENSMPLYVIPDAADIIMKGSSTINLLDTPLFLCESGEMSLLNEILKRAFDLAAAAVACVIFSPIMLLTAAAIKLGDGGPVLFKQKRLTTLEKEFYVYKFRSMVVDAEGDGKARLALENDDRITPVGKFIRRVRIDELPQIFNILMGDMSIVGPRPERPEIASEYEKTIPEFGYRLKVKAGLTGYAQVLGRYNTTPYDKLMWDLMYIENYSFYLDLKIIMMTIKILFMPESTAGFESGDESNSFAGKQM